MLHMGDIYQKYCWQPTKDNEGQKAVKQHCKNAERKKKILLDQAQRPFQNDNKVDQYYKKHQVKFFGLRKNDKGENIRSWEMNEEC